MTSVTLNTFRPWRLTVSSGLLVTKFASCQENWNRSAINSNIWVDKIACEQMLLGAKAHMQIAMLNLPRLHPCPRKIQACQRNQGQWRPCCQQATGWNGRPSASVPIAYSTLAFISPLDSKHINDHESDTKVPLQLIAHKSNGNSNGTIKTGTL